MARAHYSKLIVDGNFGPVSVRALQTYLLAKQGISPGPIDGIWGSKTVAGIQRWLHKAGYYSVYRADGVYGTATKREFARMMNNRYTHTWAHSSTHRSWRWESNLSIRGAKGAILTQHFLNYYRFV